MPSPRPESELNKQDWLEKKFSQRGDAVKLKICLVALVVILVYIGSRLKEKPLTNLTDTRTPAGSPEIKPDLLPFQGKRERENDGAATASNRSTTVVVAEPLPTDPEVLLQVKDKAHSLERDAYFYLAGQVMKSSVEELKRQANPKVTFRDVFLHPRQHRGEAIQVTGGLKRLRVTPLDPGNPLGLKRIYQGQIVDRDFRFWTFILTEKPHPSFMEGDLVRLYGRFFKIWEYETRMKNAHKLSAVVVGKRFVRVEVKEQTVMAKVVVVLALVTALFLFVAVRVTRGQDAISEARRRRKVRASRPGDINEMARKLSSKVTSQKAQLFAGGPDKTAEKEQAESAPEDDPDGDEDRRD